MSNKETNIFSEGLESLDGQGLEQDIYDTQAKTFSAESQDILDAEYIDSGDDSNVNKISAYPGNKKRKIKPIYILGVLVGFGVFTAVVLTHTPNNDFGVSKEIVPTKDPALNIDSKMVVSALNHSIESQELESKNKAVIEEQRVEISQKPSLPKGSVVSTIQSEQDKKLVTSIVPSTPLDEVDVKNTHITEETKPQPVKPADESKEKQLLDALASIQKDMKQLKAEIAKKEKSPAGTKTKKNIRNPKNKVVYLGSAINVVKVLNDAVVYKNKNNDLLVIKIGESYKRYGKLVSVNPMKNTFITTRGLWSAE